jgi:hypothetical protein
MKGWEMTEDGSLGMNIVENGDSSLFGTVPAPRVLQNQLDRMLEEYCATKEVDCLRGLQSSMYRSTSRDWTVIFVVTVIILHIRERDIWRLMYWTSLSDQVCILPINDSIY